jgi:hypothetical protein
MYLRIDGWMDGRMNEWMDGCVGLKVWSLDGEFTVR